MVKISACVIVKDEAANIGRWLDCMRHLADEMVVVDTGSTDDTAELAAAGGARVLHFAWCDDFAAAKNFALDNAQGEWVLFLDADEYFTADSVRRLPQLIKQYHPQRQVVGLICQLFNIEEADAHVLPDSMYQIRIFRNLRSLRYEGQIHEVLVNQKKGLDRRMQLVDLRIYHTGYSSRLLKKKLARNLKLIRERMARDGETPMDAFYLMDCYHGLDEYDKAIECVRKTLAAGLSFVGMEGKPYHIWLDCLTKKEATPLELHCVVDEAIAAFPDLADFYLRKGFIAWQERDYLTVERCLQKGLACRSLAQGDLQECSLDNSRKYLPAAFQELGQLAELKGKSQIAFDYYCQALAVYPYDEVLLARVYQYLRSQDDVLVIQFLNHYYDKESDAKFLCQALSKLNAGKVCLYYAGFWKSAHGRDMLMDYRGAGNYEAAAIEAAAMLEQVCQLYLAQKKGRTNAILEALLPPIYQELAQAPAQGLVGRQAVLSAAVQRLTGYRPEECMDIPACVAQAADAFGAGRRTEALHLLIGAYRRQPASSDLAYALAAMLLLDGQKEPARKVLLSCCTVTDAMRDLWEELHDDSDYPLVSIMIPTYNRPDFFWLTLQSAMAQTYTNVEIIVCDNSTDDCTAKLMEQVRDNLRIRYQRNPEARTKEENFHPFEQLARGEFLQWLMDDDILCADKLTKMVACFRQYPSVTLVTSLRGVIDGVGREMDSRSFHDLPMEAEYTVYKGRELWACLLRTIINFIGEPSAVLFRRRDLTHHYWNADCRGYKTISDVAMWLELLERGDCVIFRDPLSYYRRHGDQEGQQPDVVLLSRIEWFGLLQEAVTVKPYRLSHDDYIAGQCLLYKDWQAHQEWAKMEGTPRMYQRYQVVMEKIGSILAAEKVL